MDCYTDQPGVQLYTSNTMKGTVGKKVYENYCALCLETQGYPNSPNCPAYPSTVLKAGEPYRTTTIYKFSVQKKKTKPLPYKLRAGFFVLDAVTRGNLFKILSAE